MVGVVLAGISDGFRAVWDTEEMMLSYVFSEDSHLRLAW